MTIILMSDLREMKHRKQAELDFYTKKLAELLQQVRYLQADVNLTTRIIDMIEHETPATAVWAKVGV